MAQISLVDFDPPFFQSRNFVFDTNGQWIKDEYPRDERRRFAFTSGWGARTISADAAPKELFVAIFVFDRSVRLSVGDTIIDTASVQNISVRSRFPFGKILQIGVTAGAQLEFKYRPPLNEDNDLIDWSAKTISNAYSLKVFAYMWSATAIGRSRKLPDYGLKDKDIEAIDDIYDPLINSTEFEF